MKLTMVLHPFHPGDRGLNGTQNYIEGKKMTQAKGHRGSTDSGCLEIYHSSLPAILFEAYQNEGLFPSI